MLKFVLGVCYHSPKPKYQSNDLINEIMKDAEAISMEYPDVVIILTGYFNSLNTHSFVNDCRLIMLNDSVTHGKRVLDKFFIFRPGLFLCQTVTSCINTKHKALLNVDGSHNTASYRQPKPKVYRRCYDDVSEPSIQALQSAVATYNWFPLLQEQKV
jgi:hypothetical protein